MSKKFEEIARRLKEYWGFDLTRNNSDNLGWTAGSWRTGFTVSGNLRGHFYERFDTLAQIEKRWLSNE